MKTTHEYNLVKSTLLHPPLPNEIKLPRVKNQSAPGKQNDDRDIQSGKGKRTLINRGVIIQSEKQSQETQSALEAYRFFFCLAFGCLKYSSSYRIGDRCTRRGRSMPTRLVASATCPASYTSPPDWARSSPAQT